MFLLSESPTTGQLPAPCDPDPSSAGQQDALQGPARGPADPVDGTSPATRCEAAARPPTVPPACPPPAGPALGSAGLTPSGPQGLRNALLAATLSPACILHAHPPRGDGPESRACAGSTARGGALGVFCWMKEQIFNMTPLYLMEGRQGDTDPVCVEQGWGRVSHPPESNPLCSKVRNGSRPPRNVTSDPVATRPLVTLLCVRRTDWSPEAWGGGEVGELGAGVKSYKPPVTKQTSPGDVRRGTATTVSDTGVYPGKWPRE